MSKQVTAKQAMRAYNESKPAVQAAIKAQKATAKEAAKRQHEQELEEMYGPAHVCESCGLHYRSFAVANKCADCQGE